MHRRHELPIVANEIELHRITCDKCSATDENKEHAWTSLMSGSDCCKSFFVRRFRALFRDPAVRATAARAVLDCREEVRAASTKISESDHAHGQKFLQKSWKPVSLASLCRTMFLRRICSSRAKHGGDVKWHTRTDKLLQIRTAAITDESSQLCLSDDPSRTAGPAGQADSNNALALRAASTDQVQKPKAGHLNPVLVEFNERMHSANLLAVRVDEAYRSATLAQVKNMYANDQEYKSRLKKKYEAYLERVRRAGDTDIAGDKMALQSTYLGWGSESWPMPIKAVQDRVAARGLVPNREVWGEQASDALRVNVEEARGFQALPATVQGLACGAMLRNECRTAVKILTRDHSRLPEGG